MARRSRGSAIGTASGSPAPRSRTSSAENGTIPEIDRNSVSASFVGSDRIS
ncbi:MAG: hypothetical protein H0X59_04990 [Chloroflexi bacterium]|nr:hypothetical protein [Chloroflexota bacterium]